MKTIIAFSALRNVMKNAGASIVSREAMKKLMLALEQRASKIVSEAFVFAKHAKRKKITESDVKLAISVINDLPIYSYIKFD